jgi:hypothetical protein
VFIFCNLFIERKRIITINRLLMISLFFVFVGHLAYGSVGAIKKLREWREPGLVKWLFDEKYMHHTTVLLPGENASWQEKIVKEMKRSSQSEYFRAIDIGILNRDHKVRFIANEISTLFGCANLYPSRYHQFFKWLIDDLKVKSPKDYNSFAGWGACAGGGEFVDSIDSEFNENLLSLAGVKWILKPNEAEESRFVEKFRGNKYTLYLNDSVFPRAFAVFKLNVVEDAEDMSEIMMNSSIEELSKVVPVLKYDLKNFLPSNFLKGEGKGNVKILSYNPNEVIIDVNFSENGFLVLTDNYHESWKAMVDNVEYKLLPAYYSFRMVPVPAGRHVVRFYYHDGLFQVSIIISIMTLVVMCGMIVVGLVRENDRYSAI